MVKVTAHGWGDGHEILKTNAYKNPFWNTVGLFKTEKGHSARIAVFWHIAAGGTERGLFYGDRMSYIMQRPEGSPNTVFQISKDGQTVMDENGYPEGKVERLKFTEAAHFEMLPEPMRDGVDELLSVQDPLEILVVKDLIDPRESERGSGDDHGFPHRWRVGRCAAREHLHPLLECLREHSPELEVLVGVHACS